MPIEPSYHHFESFDHDRFQYLNWRNSSQPKTVIIAVHGINGAACDYSNLADHLLGRLDNIAIYAPETRGQGNDDNLTRRGDIYQEKEWYKDLDTFSNFIKAKHPEAEIIWCGESMGGLIVTHCYAVNNYFKPDRMILLAPVVSLKPHLPIWKHKLANFISLLLPNYRVSLAKFAGDQAVKVTQGSDNHEDQASTNSYYIEKFTLRLLAALGNMASNMNSIATKIDCPVILLTGGLDYFTPSKYSEQFYRKIPESTDNKHAHFESSYHLLMYDEHRGLIFEEISNWINVKK